MTTLHICISPGFSYRLDQSLITALLTLITLMDCNSITHLHALAHVSNELIQVTGHVRPRNGYASTNESNKCTNEYEYLHIYFYTYIHTLLIRIGLVLEIQRYLWRFPTFCYNKKFQCVVLGFNMHNCEVKRKLFVAFKK